MVFKAHRLAVPGVIAIAGASLHPGQQRQPLAPHELKHDDAPPPIIWSPPELPSRPVDFESAEERRLRLTVLATGLNQPWSIAFLPDGDALITERAGTVRVFRQGKLSDPIDGVPAVQTGGPRGLQGLMDIVLHPRFAENHWVYLTYHKPVGEDGASTLARGTWNGTRLDDVHDIFESGATDTEASRVVFGRDGMLYMTISAPGSPKVQRSQDPNDYAGKVVRLRDDGTVPDDDPFAHRAGYKPAIFTMGHRNGHALAVNPETGEIWASEQGP